MTEKSYYGIPAQMYIFPFNSCNATNLPSTTNFDIEGVRVFDGPLDSLTDLDFRSKRTSHELFSSSADRPLRVDLGYVSVSMDQMDAAHEVLHVPLHNVYKNTFL